MRADRLLTIMALLQSHGKMTARSLADRLEVSRRTILRDIDALSAAGIPVYAEGGHGGGIALDDHYRAALTGLNDQEVRALFISGNNQLLNEVHLGQVAESAMLKLRAVLPALHRPGVEHIRQRILIDPTWWYRDSRPLPFWDQLQQAVYEDRCIRAVYTRSDGERSERILEPYSLVAKSSVWYLVAVHAGELRTYRVVRFSEITLLDQHFERRADFDLPAFWQAQLRRFGELTSNYAFTLRVHPGRLNFLKEIVPGRYQPVGEPDPQGRLTLAFDLDSQELALMLVFGLGQDARVIEPPELQAAVTGAARAVLGEIDRTE
jgi:predicted DNA-binding transcriptional regulator YafY